MFLDFLEYEKDLSKDWFASYFEQNIADRKHFSQDYTPGSVSQLLSEITGYGTTTFDPAAGTGSITIGKWDYDRKATSHF